MARLLPGAATNRAAGDWAAQGVCERRLGLTDWNRSAVLTDVLRRPAEPPFVDQLNHTQQVAAVRAQWREVRRRETKEAAAPAHLNLGVALRQVGQTQDARAQFEETLRLEPGNKLAAQYLQGLPATKGEEKR